MITMLVLMKPVNCNDVAHYLPASDAINYTTNRELAVNWQHNESTYSSGSCALQNVAAH